MSFIGSGISSRFLTKVRTSLINRKVAKLNRIPRSTIPVFSVIIPIYDRVEELVEAVESILAQSFKNFELILICDGSPPATLKVVESYSDHEQIRICQFNTSSGNACRGRNKGIEMARGKYLAFLDSDDIAIENRLQRSLFHFLDKGVDVVGGAIEYLVPDGEVRGFRNGQIGFTSEACSYTQLQEGNRLSICTVAVSLRVLRQYGGFREEMRYREDHELWLRLAYHGCKFYNSPETFALYRIHQNNAEVQYLEDDSHWFEQALKLHSGPFSLTS